MAMRVSGIDWVTLVTAGVAVYGAILSTYNAFSKWVENKRLVRIGIRYGIYPENPKVFISAVNAGKRPVVLSEKWIILPNKEKADYEKVQYTSDRHLPQTLTEGDSCEYWTPARSLGASLKSRGLSGTTKLVAVFQDSLGVCYRSKALSFSIDKYADEAAKAEPSVPTSLRQV
jgi:hypothetical protein